MPRSHIRVLVFAFAVAVLLLAAGPIAHMQEPISEERSRVEAAAPEETPVETALASLTSEAPANLVVTLIIVPILQWLKRKDWRWLDWVNERSVFWISGAIAGLAALGIHVSYDPAADVGNITFSVAGLMSGSLEWVKQWAAQHWGHRALRAFETLPRALEALATLRDLQARKD